MGPVFKSRYFDTPSKKTVRMSDNFASPAAACLDRSTGATITDCLIGKVGSAPDVAGTVVRHEIKVWQDETALVDKKQIKELYLAAGALDVDIRLIRIPRHNVRSEAVLKTERLRDKIQKMAELKGEEVEWSVLSKAESLEERVPEELIAAVGRVAA